MKFIFTVLAICFFGSAATIVNNFIGVGQTLADRPTSGTITGQTFRDLETGKIYLWDGSIWSLNIAASAHVHMDAQLQLRNN